MRMPSFGMVNEHFHQSIEETCTVLADRGYDGVEITPWTVTDAVPEPPPDVAAGVRRAANSAGIEVIGIPRVFSASDAEYHIGHPNRDVRDRTLEYLRATVRFCGALGGDVVLFGSPNQRTVAGEFDDSAAWDRAIDTMVDGALLKELTMHGVTLCMEPLSPRYTDFVTSASEAVAFVEAIDHPNVGVVLDTFHLASEDEPPAEIIERSADHLAHVHADNTHGLGPAGGTVDFDEIAGALNRIGYDGYVSVELHADVLGDGVEDDPLAIASESIEFLRAAFG